MSSKSSSRVQLPFSSISPSAMYLSQTPSNGSHSPRWTLTALGLIIISLVLAIHQLIPSSFTTESLQHVSNLRDHAVHIKDSAQDALAESPFRDTAAIPNIVHFVHLVRPGPDLVFDFPFRQFVAIYSAHHYLKPEAIYIHTNVEEDLIEQTLKNATNPYTQAVIKMPGVHFKYHGVVNETSRGYKVDEMANRSDFVRTSVLKKYGGIYLDDDAYVLRDLHPLRRMGFENIIGKQEDGDICPAVIMATKNNKMMTAYHTLQDTIFDGSWAIHATKLLTSLSIEFAPHEHQVLVLPQDTFFPLTWWHDDLFNIYQVHQEPGASELHNSDISNMTDFVQDYTLWGHRTWRRDWRESCVMHGWTSSLGREISARERKLIFGKFGDITLEYVLQQNSNFARAVYPAVKNALDSGVLDHVKFEQSHDDVM